MMRDLASAFVHSAGMDPLDRLCYLQVLPLAARRGEAREQGLPHELVGKSEERLGSLGTRHDQPHALRLLEGRQQVLSFLLLEQCLEQEKAEAAADCRSRT